MTRAPPAIAADCTAFWDNQKRAPNVAGAPPAIVAASGGGDKKGGKKDNISAIQVRWEDKKREWLPVVT